MATKPTSIFLDTVPRVPTTDNRDIVLGCGTIRLYETDGTNFTTLTGQGTLSTNNTLTLPSTSGTLATIEEVNSHIASVETTVAASGLTTLDSVNTSGESHTVKYIVQIRSGTSYQSQEILMVNNGTNVYMSESNVINTSGALGVFDANLSGSTMNLTVTLNQTNNVIRFTRIVV